MRGRTLLVSRYVNWFSHFKMRLEAFGFPDVYVTGKDKDGLNGEINDMKPDFLLIGSNFYDCGTPYMIGQLLSVFPKQNIAVITTSPFPDGIATWFKFHGINFYVKWSDGPDELHHGLRCILDRKKYIAPDVQYILDEIGEYPVVPLKETKRQKEVLLMICCGFSVKRIMNDLQICRATVEKHLTELMKIYNSRDRGELVKTVNSLEIFTKEELSLHDNSNKNLELPEWAVMQRRITKIANGQRAKNREQWATNKYF